MTLDELADEVERRHQAVERFNDRLLKPKSADDERTLARLFAEAHFAREVWYVAKDHGVSAAMLFKLSDGNIDPRS